MGKYIYFLMLVQPDNLELVALQPYANSGNIENNRRSRSCTIVLSSGV